MGRKRIRIVIILATVSVLAILFVQFFFLKNTADLNEARFRDAAVRALNAVAGQLKAYNSKSRDIQAVSPPPAEVEQLTSNYYIVNVNEEINPELLEYFLIREFKKHNMDPDFEYAIYDCNQKKMLNSRSVKSGSNPLKEPRLQTKKKAGCDSDEEFFDDHYRKAMAPLSGNTLPVCEKYTYYFGVLFPNRTRFSNSGIQAWYLVNAILFVVIVFFSYTLYILVKQRRLSEVQKNFINNLTHEFKTPIASIALSARVLSERSIASRPDRLEKYAGIINNQTQRLSVQVEKVLQMASAERKKLQMEKQETELSSFLQKCIREFRDSQDEPAGSIIFHPPAIPVCVPADRFHVCNVVFNILDNAFKYSEDIPRVVIEMSLLKKTVRISFADQGIGIPKPYRKKIFKRFFRIPTGDVHNVNGFGLGLDYVKKIIQRHGWKIKLSENAPQGSIFTLIIPYS
ncbi:MAG: sensor histidine kinase [Mangrovibacterium sp.]